MKYILAEYFAALKKWGSHMKKYTSWPSMSVFAFLLVVFYKNVFIFLGVVIFKKNLLSYFMKTYVNVSTPKYASINESIWIWAQYLLILLITAHGHLVPWPK